MVFDWIRESGSCRDIVHAAKVLIERYPERFGPNGTCFLRCVLLDEKFKFRSFKRQKLFKHANRLVYSGSTDTIVVSSIPMNHQTNVLGQMKELEGLLDERFSILCERITVSLLIAIIFIRFDSSVYYSLQV